MSELGKRDLRPPALKLRASLRKLTKLTTNLSDGSQARETDLPKVSVTWPITPKTLSAGVLGKNIPSMIAADGICPICDQGVTPRRGVLYCAVCSVCQKTYHPRSAKNAGGPHFCPDPNCRKKAARGAVIHPDAPFRRITSVRTELL